MEHECERGLFPSPQCVHMLDLKAWEICCGKDNERDIHILWFLYNVHTASVVLACVPDVEQEGLKIRVEE